METRRRQVRGLALADVLPQPVWTARPDGTVDYANPFWRAFTGFSTEASLGNGWAAAVHPDDVAAVMGRFRAAAETARPYEVEYRFRRADGAYLWHLARVAPIPGSGNSAAGWVGAAVDIDARRRAEEALQASESGFRDLVDHVNDIVYTLSLDGVVGMVNAAVDRVLGYRPEELVGRSIETLVRPEELVRSRGMLARKLAGGERSLYDLGVVAKDGRRVTLEVNTRVVEGHGRPPAIHGIARDVTEQRAAQAERRRRERQAELAAAVAVALTALLPFADQMQRCAEAVVAHLDAAFARIWTLDADDPAVLVLRASAGRYTHLDGPHGRIPVGAWKIGRIAARRRPHLTNDVGGDPEISDRAWAEREGMVAFAGYPLLVGERLLGVLGLFARHPLEDPTLGVLGSAAHMIAVGIARAESETARTALLLRAEAARAHAEAAEARYRGLFEGVADAILVADAGRRYRDANAAAAALLGYGREEIRDLRVEDVVAAGPDWTAAEFGRFPAEGSWQGELELRHKDGTSIPVEARATVVDLPGGPVNISAVRDIRARRAGEREQQEFLEAVSHDLKNPMTVMRVQVQLLRRGVARDRVDGRRLAEALATMETAARQMEAQLNELQDAARLRSGNPLELRAVATDLVALATDAAAAARAGTARHQLAVESTEPGIVGLWDPLRLRRVVDNLLGNAVAYSPRGGPVTVSVRREHGPDGSWAVLTVADAGLGIPAADLPHVFERYRRGANVGRRTTGSGIGLAGVRRIVEQHGGTVGAESREGHGSAFSVRLPLAGPG